MAVLFASDTFLPAVTTGEDFLKLRDTSGTIRYKIYNNTIASQYVTQDTLIIKTKGDSKIINLKFKTNTDAQTALVKLQMVINQIRENFEIHKNSKFSDLSFEIYNDTNNTHKVNFNLNNLTDSRVLSFGTGNVLQTENEVNATLNNKDQFRFFEHFLMAHSLTQGTYNTGMIKSRANEAGHAGVIELTLGNSNSDAYLWSFVKGFLLDKDFTFGINFRLSHLPTADNNYKIAIGFFNANTTSTISKGAHFLYDYTLNDNWLVRTSNSTSTLQNTLMPLNTNWHTFNIQLNDNGELEFIIDDIIVSTVDSNIPNQFGSEVAFGILYEKLDSTAPTSVFVDWIKFDIDL